MQPQETQAVIQTLGELLNAAARPTSEDGPVILCHREFDPLLLEEIYVISCDRNYESDGAIISGDKLVNRKLADGFQLVHMFIARDFCSNESTRHVVMLVLVRLKTTCGDTTRRP